MGSFLATDVTLKSPQGTTDGKQRGPCKRFTVMLTCKQFTSTSSDSTPDAVNTQE